MPLCMLPNEILIQIISYILPDDLENAAAVSRRWHDLAAPFIFTHHAMKTQYGSIYLGYDDEWDQQTDEQERIYWTPITFLNAIANDRRLAYYPTYLCLRQVDQVFADDIDIDPEDSGQSILILAAAKKIAKDTEGFKSLLTDSIYFSTTEVADWSGAIMDGTGCAAFALLISLLPNLQELDLAILDAGYILPMVEKIAKFAGAPEEESDDSAASPTASPTVQSPIGSSTIQSPVSSSTIQSPVGSSVIPSSYPLGKLESLTVSPFNTTKVLGCLQDLAPFLSLPSLRTIRINHLLTEASNDSFNDLDFGISSVETIVLADSVVWYEHLEPFLSSMIGLKYFQYGAQNELSSDQEYVQYCARNLCELLVDTAANTLEELRIQDPEDEESPQRTYSLRSLQRLNRLRVLDLDLCMVRGNHYCGTGGDIDGDARLASVLPPSLEVLRLHKVPTSPAAVLAVFSGFVEARREELPRLRLIEVFSAMGRVARIIRRIGRDAGVEVVIRVL